MVVESAVAKFPHAIFVWKSYQYCDPAVSAVKQEEEENFVRDLLR